MRRAMRRGGRDLEVVPVSAFVVVLLVLLVGGGTTAGVRELYQYSGKGGGLYGLERDETGISNAETKKAMETLRRAEGSGVDLLTAKGAADEQLPWLRPFYARQMKAAERVWGKGQVASAVDTEGRSVYYDALHSDKQSQWANAAMGSYTVPLDAQVVPPSQEREKADAEAVTSAQENKDYVSLEQLAELPSWAERGRDRIITRANIRVGADTSDSDNLLNDVAHFYNRGKQASPLTKLSAGWESKKGGLSIFARQQQLAEIYGVQITDRDARKFFGTDYEKKYKPPTPAELHAYIQWLVDHSKLPKPGNITNATEAEEEEKKEEEEEMEEEEEVDEGEKRMWPELPTFGKEHKYVPATQWCSWGGGQEEVPCRIGADGAWYDEPFSAGVWGRHTPNRETLVNNGVWRFPGDKPPKARAPPKTVRTSTSDFAEVKSRPSPTISGRSIMYGPAAR